MNRTYFKLAIALMWLALPLTALRYWRVWDQLPARMATHFDAAGSPNGWMTREASLIFALVLTTILLIVFSVILYLAQLRSTQGQFPWALLAFFGLIVAVIYRVNSSVVDHALTGAPVEVGWVLLTVPLAILGLMVVCFRANRGSAFPMSESDIIAEETHTGRAWALFLMLPAIPVLTAAIAIHVPMARIGMALISLIVLISVAAAWSGFQYRFTRYGLEITTLGFRLRSIPIDQIREYTIASRSAWGGYGIRGVGNDRAYVWGNRGVRIKTSSGEVFLGHSEPQRIVRDLDAMKQFAHS
jgi:hypothetical protein